MIERICHIDKELEDSIFLFGARQTGKSTFLRRKRIRDAALYTFVYHYTFAAKSKSLII